jgi:apolipoprotein N-acyltransferase
LRAWFALPQTVAARRPGLAWQALAVALLLTGTFSYGMWRLHGEPFRRGPRVALLQGNEPQAVRNAKYNDVDEAKIKADAETHVDYLALHDIAERAKPDLIIWPETSYHRDGVDYSLEFLTVALETARKHYQAEAKGVQPPTLAQWRQMWIEHSNPAILSEAKTWRSAELLGLNCDELQVHGSRKFRNSALLVLPGGKYAGRYDKVHRVPWGEYVPLKDWIPAMNAFAPYDHEYSIAPGDEMTRFPLGEYSFGAVICYEDSDPYLARQLVKGPEDNAWLDYLTRLVAGGMYDHLPRTSPNAKPVDFLINTSNDGWFDGTSEHEEHLAICRFRAVECRRSVVRAVNMGISALIDGNGRVLAPIGTQEVADRVPVWEINGETNDLPVSRWSNYKKVAGVRIAQVPIDGRGSLYVRWGDWLPAACWVVVLLALLWPASVARGKPQPASK